MGPIRCSWTHTFSRNRPSLHMPAHKRQGGSYMARVHRVTRISGIQHFSVDRECLELTRDKVRPTCKKNWRSRGEYDSKSRILDSGSVVKTRNNSF